MRRSARVLLGAAFWFPACLAAQCPPQSGLYEGFRITRVSIETPLQFPIRLVEETLLRRESHSEELIAASLPVKRGGAFHSADHFAAITQIRDGNSIMRPGERIRLTLVVPAFPACDMSARTVEVVYHVYTTDAGYFSSRLLESSEPSPERSLGLYSTELLRANQDREGSVNESIQTPEVRAVFPDGTTAIMLTAAALRKAQDMGLDLVLVDPNAVPPVAKAVEFGHYNYVDTTSARRRWISAAPFTGYDRALQTFGGIKAAWNGAGTVLNSAGLEVGGSSSSYRADFAFGGSRDPDQGPFSHVEWNVGFRSSQDPAGPMKLTKSIAIAQGIAATRAYGPLGFMFRFGLEVEAGKGTSGTVPGFLSDAPQRVLKSFVGSTWSHGRNIWNLSYGFQVGRGTNTAPVDYTKHLVDVSHQVRLLPWEHLPVQLDSHFDAGWIFGSDAVIPVTERFFGGNLPADFIENSMWTFPSGPLLRSFPHNGLNVSASGQAIGGTTFMGLNLTAALPLWSYPAMPDVVRHAKPLEDGIHLGLQAAQGASLEDFRARTKLFPAVLNEVNVVGPVLERLSNRLSGLIKQGLSDDLTSELNDLIDNYITPTIADIAKAQELPDNGLAWSICRRMSKDDPDIYPLAHLSDDLANVVVPGLTAAGFQTDASDLQAIGTSLNQHRARIGVLLAPIEPVAVVPLSTLDAFRDDLGTLSKVAEDLRTTAQVFAGAGTEIATLAFNVVERSTSIINAAVDPGPDSDAFDSLYILTRLAVGIGKLVPPQIDSAAQAADQLSEAVRNDHPAESQQISRLADSLRVSLARIRPRLEAIPTPAGERWARQQNQYFVRALDVAFREMNLAAVSPVVAFDAARIGPAVTGLPNVRYGIGPGIRFSIVSFHVTLGYSFNPDRQGREKQGAFFFSMDITDLFR